MMPSSPRVPAKMLVQPVLDDVAARRRQAFGGLSLLVRKRRRRMRQPAVVERRGLVQQMPLRHRGRHVVLADEAAAHVARADPQLQQHRRARRLRQREALLDHPHHVREVGARVEQDQRRLQRERVRALLDDARAFAVVLADDDQRAAGDAGRREIRQRVGRDVGADDRLPGDGAAQRIVDRRAQHRRRRRLVRAGLDVDAELGQVVLRLDEHVHQVRHRRALVAADVGDARLQQRLGDREDAFAVKHLAAAPGGAAALPG